MNLSNDIYLRSAFRELDAFAIDQIGTFRKIYHSAHEESFTGDIHPPSIEVEFKEQIEKDLLLEFYLTDSIHLSKKTSNQVVQDIQKGIFSSIESQGYYEIAGIGKLKKGNAGNLYFIPVDVKDNIFSSDFYGLQPVHFHTDSDQGDPTINDTMTSEENQFEPQPTPPKGYWFGWKAAAFLGVVLLFGLSLLVLDWPMQAKLKRASLIEGPKVRNMGADQWLAENNTNNTEISSDSFESLDNPTVSDVIEDPSADTESRSIATNDFEPVNTQDQSTTPSTQSADTPSSEDNTVAIRSTTTARKDNPESVSRGVTRGETKNDNSISTGRNISILSESEGVTRGSGNKTYYVISGSFDSMSQARVSANTMRNKGYPNVTIVQADNKYRVSIFNTFDSSIAERIKTEARRKGIKDAWVFSK